METFRHEFVEFIPEELEEGVIYVSLEHATATHLCACGCGSEVVTPISPTDWQVIFDGETVSLKPSIGNWSLPCGSHYWLQRGRVHWAGKWSRERIEAGRARDRQNKERYAAGLPIEQVEPVVEEPASKRLLRRLFRKFRG